MQENRNDSALRLLVTCTRQDGRQRYDLQSRARWRGRAYSRTYPWRE